MSFGLFVRYPYLLPAMLVSLIAAAAAITAILYLTETLSRNTHTNKSAAPIRELVTYKPFQKIVMLYSINNGVMFSWEAVYPLFAYTSVELGGLGLGVSTPARAASDSRSR